MQRLLALPEDIFEGYGENEFRDLLTAQSRIERKLAISNSGRRLIWYQKDELINRLRAAPHTTALPWRPRSVLDSRQHSRARAPSRVSTEMQSIGRRLPHHGTSSCEMQLSPCETANSRMRSADTLRARRWVRSTTTPDRTAARPIAETSRPPSPRSTVAEPDAAGPTGMEAPSQPLIACSPLK